MKRQTRVHFLVAGWIGYVLLAGVSLPQDQSPVDLTGKVTQIVFKNPNVHFNFKVLKKEGVPEAQWKCYTGAMVAELKQGGWKEDSLLKGERITIQGNLPDASHLSVTALIVKGEQLKASKPITCERLP